MGSLSPSCSLMAVGILSSSTGLGGVGSGAARDSLVMMQRRPELVFPLIDFPVTVAIICISTLDYIQRPRTCVLPDLTTRATLGGRGPIVCQGRRGPPREVSLEVG